MNEILNRILKGFDETDRMYKKVSLLEKKREKWGLTDEESTQLKEMQIQYFIRCEEIISEVVSVFIDKLMSPEGEKALKIIQELVPWSGRIIIHSEEIDAIMDAVSQLDEKQLRKIRKNLKILHQEVFKSIEKACQSDEILDSFERLGLIVTNGKADADIIDAISYIDSIYREFGDIVGARLMNVKVEREIE